MIALMRHRGDDAGLAVVPAMRGDAGVFADRRARAVGADQQARGDRFRRRPSVTSMRAIGVVLEIRRPRWRAARRRRPSPCRSARDQRAVLDHVRERLARLRPRRRRSGRSAAPRRRAWCRSPPCRGSAAPRRDRAPRRRWSRTAAAPPPRWPRRADRSDAPRARPGSATVTAKLSPSACRSAIAEREPGKAAAADHHVRTLGLRCIRCSRRHWLLRHYTAQCRSRADSGPSREIRHVRPPSRTCSTSSISNSSR